MTARRTNFDSRGFEYPWKKWFDILERELEIWLDRGIDFPEKQPIYTVKEALRKRAKRHNLILTFDKKTDLNTIHAIIHDPSKPHFWSYPWEKWLIGKPVPLKPGVDFECTVHTMRYNARSKAQIGYWSKYDEYHDILWICGEMNAATAARIKRENRNSE